MVRFFLPFLGALLLVQGLMAQDLGRTDRLWKEYLAETVRRGSPLLPDQPGNRSVPYWPALDRVRSEAQILEPSDDVTLLAAWIDRAEGLADGQVLKVAWPRPVLQRFTYRQWGESLFASWNPADQPQEWTNAWLAWSEKVYSPTALVRGLSVLELTDVSAVIPLATQALELYPEDRRFLPFVLRHPELALNPVDLLSRDRTNNGGWSLSTLRVLVDRSPDSLALLRQAGYDDSSLAMSNSRDYGLWLAAAPGKTPEPGHWTWDSDRDGFAETDLVFQAEGLVSWSRRTESGVWTLSFRDGRPASLVETRSGSSWTLIWESYPWAAKLEYRWGDQTLVYRFRPLALSVPLWPQDRFRTAPDRLPAALATLWLPLNPKEWAKSAATVETWSEQHKVETVFLYRGEVWMEVQDSDRDGTDDTWSYFKSGRLASVYRNLEGRGSLGLRELYRKGELDQVQVKSTGTRNEFVLFPLQGVQLWDPHGDRRPLERLFFWEGGDTLGALVFTRDELPWETMPSWEPRP